AIAQRLAWKLVTITPSDFVKEGVERSESMARTLFSDLMQLREVVVLFDEIDEMLRDRSESSDAGGAISILRFLVPGMLPKLQTLNKYSKKSKLIFIIATNYKERLDSAVVRRGRIDEEFCIPPPDRRARRQLFTMQLKRLAPVGSTVPKDGLLIERLADLTPGWVFKEIENLAYIAGTIDDSARKQLLDDL